MKNCKKNLIHIVLSLFGQFSEMSNKHSSVNVRDKALLNERLIMMIIIFLIIIINTVFLSPVLVLVGGSPGSQTGHCRGLLQSVDPQTGWGRR